MSSTDIVQIWADQIQLRPGEDLTCPRCHGLTFTVRRAEYGWELACFNEPTYIGVIIEREAAGG